MTDGDAPSSASSNDTSPLSDHLEDAAQGLDPAISELADVFREFNRMTEHLQRTHERWQQEVQGLKEELRQKDEALQRKRRVEELGEMAAGVAHEIRNPLGGIALWGSLLVRDLAEHPEARRLAKKICDAAQHTNRIVQELLDFTNVPGPEYTEFSPASLIGEAVGLLQPLIAERSVDVREDVDGGSGRIHADAGMVRQLILNLLTNALEHSPEGGEVRIAGVLEDDEFLLAVTDAGPGVPIDLRSKIFDPFFTRRKGGTGLGLSIVSRIVTAHSGSVRVCDAAGGGARFEVRIPASPPPISTPATGQDPDSERPGKANETQPSLLPDPRERAGQETPAP